MDTAMKELLWVLKTMPAKQVVDFMADLFVWLDEETQTMFVEKVGQLMWQWEEKAPEWEQKTPQQEKNMTQPKQKTPPVDVSNIF